ncbi:MAG: DUF4458 domain-containing protein, partial [Alistipes sp.]|nr:DUF4458 domain-containing protein [Alistipes sp.]
MRHKFILLWHMVLSSVMLLTTGCQKESNDELSADYGYVQFHILKDYPGNGAEQSRAGNILEWLGDAHKISVTLQQENGGYITQTLPITINDRDDAEWGVQSDKLRLLVGTYRINNCVLYNNFDEVLCEGDIQSHEFKVVKNGLTKDNLIIENSIKRGKIAFRLVKEFPTRAEFSGEYLFSAIKAVDITVKHKTFGKESTIEARQLSMREEFKTSEDKTATLSTYIECVGDHWLEVGNYTIVGYKLYSDTKAKYIIEDVDISEFKREFSVTHNQLNVVTDVPILLSKSAEHIKDYVALKEIWEALDGPNWSFHGEEYPAGTNWNFDKEIDLWGEQPGVTLNAEGRVENLNLSGFGAEGVIPEAIGQLTDLKLLYLGNHNELIGGYDANSSKAGRLDAMDYHDKMLKRDVREGLSTELKSVINRDATQRPIIKSRINLKDVAFGNLTNGITGISRAMMRLTKLEQFFIANAPITVENFFVEVSQESPYYAEKDSWSWENFTNLADVEIYNCSKLKALPRELITELPNIQSLNVAMNYGISAEQLKEDWEALIGGASGDKVQILYLGFNNLEETPSTEELAKMSRLGLLDCNSNKLHTVHPFGKSINPTTIYFDYNNISKIYTAEDGYFCGLSQLETLSCSNNAIELLPDLFTARSVYTAITVDFSSNKITGLENGDAWRGVNTETLNLANNRLEELPARLMGSGSYINILMLSANGMREIKPGALMGAGSEGLTTIDLSFNRLKELPYDDFSITNIPYLYGIDLSNNALNAVPQAPLSVNSLTVLSIRQQRDDEGNRTLQEWPTGIGNHEKLAAFYIGSNDLGVIEDKISPYILLFEIKDNPNISIDVSNVCEYIKKGYYELVYDSTQDIRG